MYLPTENKVWTKEITKEEKRSIERLKEYDFLNSCVMVNITKVNRIKFYIPQKKTHHRHGHDRVKLDSLDHDISVLLGYKNTDDGLCISGDGQEGVEFVLYFLKHFILEWKTDRLIEFQIV